jgi:AmiR/NasT family two-component response regulator
VCKPPKLKVMLVDENPDRAADVRAALVASGCEVLSLLASSLEIYDAVKITSPDVIITDTESPSRDSLENLAFVSRDRPHPIVMFSGDRSSETISEAIRAGVMVAEAMQGRMVVAGDDGSGYPSHKYWQPGDYRRRRDRAVCAYASG